MSDDGIDDDCIISLWSKFNNKKITVLSLNFILPTAF